MFAQRFAQRFLRPAVVSSRNFGTTRLLKIELKPSRIPEKEAQPLKPKEETEFEQALEEAKKDAFAVKQEKIVVKKPLMERIKDEMLHYWHGTKLLAAETKISGRLLLKLLKGKELSRREYRQLKRTTGDLLRLIPLVIIVVIPFLEFALPVLLKLFPSMLPSTFESKGQEVMFHSCRKSAKRIFCCFVSKWLNSCKKRLLKYHFLVLESKMLPRNSMISLASVEFRANLL
jgi:hypothetical protein